MLKWRSASTTTEAWPAWFVVCNLVLWVVEHLSYASASTARWEIDCQILWAQKEWCLVFEWCTSAQHTFSYLQLTAVMHHFAYWLNYPLQEYLRHFYGYKPKSERQKRTTDAGVDDDWTTGLCDKVQKMQRFFGLPPSGELTNETLAVMKRPRCGLSDVEQFGETIRWKKSSLSYRLEMIRKQCSKNGTDGIVTEKKARPIRRNHTLRSIPVPLWGCPLS